MSDAPEPASDGAADAEQPHQIIDSTSAPTSTQEQEKNQAATELAGSGAKSGALSMELKVHSPFKDYFEGQAFSISGENLTGPFDILPRHHNFITLLSACELVIRSPRGDEKIQIGGGIMHVKADQVIVFLDV